MRPIGRRGNAGTLQFSTGIQESTTMQYVKEGEEKQRQRDQPTARHVWPGSGSRECIRFVSQCDNSTSHYSILTHSLVSEPNGSRFLNLQHWRPDVGPGQVHQVNWKSPRAFRGKANVFFNCPQSLTAAWRLAQKAVRQEKRGTATAQPQAHRGRGRPWLGERQKDAGAGKRCSPDLSGKQQEERTGQKESNFYKEGRKIK